MASAEKACDESNISANQMTFIFLTVLLENCCKELTDRDMFLHVTTGAEKDT